MKFFYTMALIALSAISLQLSALSSTDKQNLTMLKQQALADLNQAHEKLNTAVNNFKIAVGQNKLSLSDIGSLFKHAGDIGNAIKSVAQKVNDTLQLHKALQGAAEVTEAMAIGGLKGLSQGQRQQ